MTLKRVILNSAKDKHTYQAMVDAAWNAHSKDDIIDIMKFEVGAWYTYRKEKLTDDKVSTKDERYVEGVEWMKEYMKSSM